MDKIRFHGWYRPNPKWDMEHVMNDMREKYKNYITRTYNTMEFRYNKKYEYKPLNMDIFIDNLKGLIDKYILLVEEEHPELKGYIGEMMYDYMSPKIDEYINKNIIIYRNFLRDVIDMVPIIHMICCRNYYGSDNIRNFSIYYTNGNMKESISNITQIITSYFANSEDYDPNIMSEMTKTGVNNHINYMESLDPILGSLIGDTIRDELWDLIDKYSNENNFSKLCKIMLRIPKIHAYVANDYKNKIDVKSARKL